MAAADHTKTTLARNVTGVNVTDATYETLVAGASNGVQFDYDEGDLILLKNDTGGDAVFTFTVPLPSSFSSVGATVTSPTKTIATGKVWAFRPTDIFRNSSGKMTITCDVAGKICVYDQT